MVEREILYDIDIKKKKGALFMNCIQDESFIDIHKAKKIKSLKV